MNLFNWSKSPWFMPVLILAALAIGTATYFPALAYINDLRDRLATNQQTLARLNSRIEVGKIAADASHENISPFAGDFLPGTDASLVVAGLQNQLRDLVMKNNVELNSSNTLPVRTDAGVTYVGLHIVLRGEIKDTQRVLHTIETGKPLLFVSRVVMRMDTWAITSNDPGRNGQPALVSELDVFGPMLPEGVAEAERNASSTSTTAGPPPAIRSTPIRGRR
jgi:general secretion pathway protein M